MRMGAVQGYLCCECIRAGEITFGFWCSIHPFSCSLSLITLHTADRVGACLEIRTVGGPAERHRPRGARLRFAREMFGDKSGLPKMPVRFSVVLSLSNLQLKIAAPGQVVEFMFNNESARFELKPGSSRAGWWLRHRAKPAGWAETGVFVTRYEF